MKSKKTAAKKTKAKTPSRATRQGMSRPPRPCSVCHKTGHNARSHKPGGRFERKVTAELGKMTRRKY